MNYLHLQVDILKSLRGRRTQTALSEQMKYQFNQIHKWETGKIRISWSEFIHLCRVCGVDLEKALRIAFSYSSDVESTASLLGHFFANRKNSEIALDLGVSRSTISRWMTDHHAPDVPQMFQIMHTGSPDFFRFLEILTGTVHLPSLQDTLRIEHAYLALYDRYPWLSVLLSALDLVGYRENPTTSFLSQVTHLDREKIKSAISDLVKQDLLVWNEKYWVAKIGRISLRNSIEIRKKMATYVQTTVRSGLEAGFGSPSCRFSWKIFSLDRDQY